MTQFCTSNSGDSDIFIRTSQFEPRASSARYVNENKEDFSEHSGKNEYKRRNGFLNEKLKKSGYFAEIYTILLFLFVLYFNINENIKDREREICLHFLPLQTCSDYARVLYVWYYLM